MKTNTGNSRRRALMLCSILLLNTNLLKGELFLITGTPTNDYGVTYPSYLIKVGEDGSLHVTSELSKKEDGTNWINISHEQRTAVMVEEGLGDRTNTITVVDLDKARIVKHCTIPQWKESTPLRQWLVRGSRADLIYVRFSRRDLEWHLDSFDTDEQRPCKSSASTANPALLANNLVHGLTGVTDEASKDVVSVFPDASGLVALAIPLESGPQIIPLGLKVPPSLLPVAKDTARYLIVNNRDAAVLGFSKRDASPWDLLVNRKSDGTWRRLQLGYDLSLKSSFPNLRGFGHYIAIIESRAPTSPDEQSAGREEWRAEDTEKGQRFAARLDKIGGVFPGRLHIYDVQSEQLYTIVTNQADSEIILIEGRKVYYRASDRLYEAFIGEKEIEGAHLLVKSEEIRDAHWAFTSR